MVGGAHDGGLAAPNFSPALPATMRVCQGRCRPLERPRSERRRGALRLDRGALPGPPGLAAGARLRSGGCWAGAEGQCEGPSASWVGFGSAGGCFLTADAAYAFYQRVEGTQLARGGLLAARMARKAAWAIAGPPRRSWPGRWACWATCPEPAAARTRHSVVLLARRCARGRLHPFKRKKDSAN